MSTRTVPAAEWPSFLARFGRAHRAWLTTVERSLPGGRLRVEARWRPFDTVVAREVPGRPIAIELRFQDALEPMAVVVRRPCTVRVNETPEGAERGLDIEDAEGACTRVRFRATALPETLNGVAPGELPKGGHVYATLGRVGSQAQISVVSACSLSMMTPKREDFFSPEGDERDLT